MNLKDDSGRVPLPSLALAQRVTSSFLILTPETIIKPLEAAVGTGDPPDGNVLDAIEGLRSVVSAANLPFQLACSSVQQRRFDRILSAERIRSLKDAPSGADLSEELERKSGEIAHQRMTEFMASAEGSDFLRDAVLSELNNGLSSKAVSDAARELMNQALVGTWAIFEHFASRFIIDRVNAHPRLAKVVLAAPELKSYFGKQLVDIEAIDEHGYDLTGKMGSIIFRGKRLDNLSVLRGLLGVMFDDGELRDALGGELWMLNQRRHLMVHKRGLVDREYLDRTGDSLKLGQRLAVTSGDVEGYLLAVQRAILALTKAGNVEADNVPKRTQDSV